MSVIIGVDPGKTTGWARLDTIDHTIVTGQSVGLEETFHYLHSFIHAEANAQAVFVVEDYIVRPPAMRGVTSFEHTWHKPIAVNVIGAIQYACTIEEREYILQQPSIKPPGYAFAGLEYIKGSKRKGVHMDDATAHCYFYAVKELGYPPVKNLDYPPVRRL